VADNSTFGFNASDIERIANPAVGARALQALAAADARVGAQTGYSSADIVRIAGNTCGLQALAAAVGARPRVADQRSPDEIRRTQNLHRRGRVLGLNDLPIMRQNLGHTAGTPEQQQRARTYITRLSGVAESLYRADWGTLRSTARETLNDAADDYEADRIIGADYESIAQQLAIVFRRVPD